MFMEGTVDNKKDKGTPPPWEFKTFDMEYGPGRWERKGQD